ncbi:MAG: ABC transporter ATP-binding protein [Ruminococcus sp.]|nr:ABC transporter ATP-binding protein [Ruminococcus sp.]MCI6504861.1 ABC transporter ATP-binding protein [Ruminococcus sp.]
MKILELKNITKIYGKGDSETKALDGVDLTIEKGDFCAIMGPSGSGKSTLLNILGCMDTPTSGEYILKGQDVSKMKNKQLSKLRNQVISFVFQYFALMDEYTVLDNIMLPLNCQKYPYKEKKDRVNYYMKRLGIEKYAKKKPTQLSGGQQQRVAIARALVSNADIILADEPTGALDSTTGEELMELLQEINDSGKTLILVTHNEKVAEKCNYVIYIEDGKIVDKLS